MAVRMKNRRKIVFDNTLYLWYVKEDDDSAYNVLNILSHDKSLVLSCSLGIKKAYIISKGRTFRNTHINGWHRYYLPFDIPEIITPKFVSDLIQWAVQENDELKELKWDSDNFPV